MVPDHACVPGLDRPVSVSEYATLKGVREAEVLAAIRALKIRSAFFRGQWYVEAPPNCEERLAQLRGERQMPHDDKARASRDPINEDKHRRSEPKLVSTQTPQVASETQETPRPQPVDYGLTHDDLNLYSDLRTCWWCPLDNGKTIQCLRARPDDKYKKGRRWFRLLIPRDWRDRERRGYTAGAAAFWLALFGVLTSVNAKTSEDRLIGFSLLGVAFACLLYAIIPGILIKQLRRRASPGLRAYWQALQTYDDNKAAAEAAARAAERDAEVRKCSYWAFLDGYEFERATAEVLQRHQFNPRVTPGSADGGVDIEVTRSGLKGVVQCKAHVACVGPHVVRDLYGVIHHSKVDFGIIVSRGGFSKGAIDFARDKPILFLDTSDLIAMQEGRDVLAAAFAPRDANNASRQE